MEAHHTIEVPRLGAVSSLWSGDPTASTVIILAHGAGNDMHAVFLKDLATAFATAGLLCIRFNFLYKELGRRAPDRAPALESTWRAVIGYVRQHAPGLERLVLSGKSMGGRIASMMVGTDVKDVAGLIFYGYPLHPPGKPERMRHAHLPEVPCQMLFIQGTRDNLCDLQRLRPILKELPGTTLHEIDGGDHSFKVLKKSGREPAEVLEEIVQTSLAWIAGLK